MEELIYGPDCIFDKSNKTASETRFRAASVPKLTEQILLRSDMAPRLYGPCAITRQPPI